jgi:acyl-CoA synthetase (NDP forming)/GNAT superfamily N-acetyltransferase
MTEGDAILLDGSTVHLRSLTSADRTAVVALFDSLSPESRRRRFFTAMKKLEGPLLDRLLQVDHDDAIVIVAVRNGRIVGVGRSNREMSSTGEKTDRSEVAFTVADELQGHGIATLLLEALATRARLVGITHFVAMTQSDNGAMLRVFRAAGYDASIHHDPLDPAIMLISFLIAEDEGSRAARRERERQAARASLEPLLRPRSVAVIGASANKLTPGRRVVQELVAHGYTGPIYPVNPHAKSIGSLPCFASIVAINQPVDLAIIAVPALEVVEVARRCAEAGVRGILVLSSGFAEVGDAGRARQAELLTVVRDSGMRCIGPNCLGVITTNDTVRMHAVFTDLDVLAGSVALMSQSGAVAMAIAGLAHQRGIGFSSVVSVGNKVDVSGNDLLEYWDQDEQTRVIALYLESFGNPRKFARLAREISRRKPIVAIKAARSDAGRRAASSHTGALAAPDATVDALFDQAGISRVEEPRELLDLCMALDLLPLPKGRRVAIVGNAGGLAILAADALTYGGLALAEFAPKTVEALKTLAPPNAAATNPVDLTATMAPKQLAQAVRCVSADPGVDAVIVVHVPVLADPQDEITTMLSKLSASAPKPIIAVFGTDRDARVPPVPTPLVSTANAREAALLLGHMAERREWLDRQEENEFPISPAALTRIRSIISAGMLQGANDGWLPIMAAFEIISLAGIKVAGPVLATSSDEAAAIAAAIGFPVSVKAANPGLLHRSDVGAVRIGVRDEYNVLCAYEAIEHDLGDSMGGALIQAMAPPGVEMILGTSNDRHFGPLVLVGAGGRMAELWRDTALHLAPLGRQGATSMIASLRSHRLLTGFRGSEPADEPVLIEALLRVAQLAAEFPEIAELDMNPLIVHRHGATAVDAKIRLAANPSAEHDDLRLLR